MPNLLRLTFLVAALALVAAACSSSERPVATVNGEDITLEQVGAVAPSIGDGASVSGELLRQELALVVIETALLQAARDDHGVVITEDLIVDRITNPPPRYEGVFIDLEGVEATSAKVRSQAILSLVRDGVVPQLIEEEGIDQFLAENRAAMTRICVQVLVFLDEDVAAASAARLKAGEDFETVAAEAGQAAPGRVGAADNTGACPNFASTLEASVAEVAVSVEEGEFVGPIAANAGLVVLKVTNKQEPPTTSADIMDFIDSRIASNFFTPWFNGVMQVAVVEINPNIGTWSVTGVGIIPPE